MAETNPKIVESVQKSLAAIEITYETIAKALKYLHRYGYITLDGEISVTEIANGIALFQQFFQLNQTGALDLKTATAMNEPRCGVADILPSNLGVEEAKWRKKNLTYRVAARDSDMNKDVWDEMLKLAWQDWMDVCDIKITQTNATNADIVCSVGTGSSQNFDGPGGTLAWAYLPSGNDRQLLMRFDTGETWTTNLQSRGILLRNVACHEFGHLLGLNHSSKQSALMAPYYSPGVVKPQMNDDIPRIRAYYGKQVTPTEPTDPTPPNDPGNPSPTEKTVITIHGRVTDVSIPGYRIVKTED